MRYLAIYFPELQLDHFLLQQPDQRNKPFALTIKDHGRPVVAAVNAPALPFGISKGQSGADAKSLLAGLTLFETADKLEEILLPRFAESSIRFSPLISLQYPAHIIINATGCTHLWGSEENYVNAVRNYFVQAGYRTILSLSSAAAASVSFSLSGSFSQIITPSNHDRSIRLLATDTISIPDETKERLKKLGLVRCGQLLDMPRASLQRRFGAVLNAALGALKGNSFDFLKYIEEPDPYVERLPCPDQVNGRPAIESAMNVLLNRLCLRLAKEEKAAKIFRFGFLRADDVKQRIAISMRKPSNNIEHLKKLLQEKITDLDPGPGICLFLLKASEVQDAAQDQHVIWDAGLKQAETQRAELLDRFSQRYGNENIRQYVFAQHYWPERSISMATKAEQKSDPVSVPAKPRPIVLFKNPAPVTVTAPIPDYPPMLFRYQNEIHRVIKADGPERIEQEWWISPGLHRDYYAVEDQHGSRFWIFREGHYNENKSADWFLHGIFA